jgi:gamma-glutamyltranspeptidase/glutathione hydrolase
MPDIDEIKFRGPVMGQNAMVASAHPLVSQAGVDVMRNGGTAFDAAFAMSALLPVVKPSLNHLGGDAYVLVYPKAEGRATAICSGGKAPAAATLDAYTGGIPQHGGAAAAIPGLVDAWEVFHSRWCTRPRNVLMQPAISAARDGFPVSRELALTLGGTPRFFAKYEAMGRALYIDGRPPLFGEVLRQPALADTLERIAADGRKALYEGAIAEKIASGVQAMGGHMTPDDLARHSADVLEPLSVDYRGYTVVETPPNSQGMILLEELKIVEGFDLARWGHLSPDAVHHLVEAKKLAFEDRERFAGDPAFVDFDPRHLLTDEWTAQRCSLINPRRSRPALEPVPTSDTTSFVVVDGEGNACSFIQSLYAGWGSAVAIDGTGIIMNNRMTGFSLDRSSPNALAPGKRTMHTLNTYLVLKDDELVIAGNTPGGHYQVQTNFQILTNMLDFELDPQAAIDAARWGDSEGRLLVEDHMPSTTQSELARRGHNVQPIARTRAPMGRAQVIQRTVESVLIGGSDERGEGAAAGW